MAGEAIASVGVTTFNGCSSLVTLILRIGAVIPLTNVNAFTGTPIANGTGYIYVPGAFVDAMKTSGNWPTYADQIRAIEDFPEITGG